MRGTRGDPLKLGVRPSLLRAASIAAIAACSSPAVTPAPVPVPVTLADAATADDVDRYRRAGFIVGDGAIPFVGMVRFVATEYLDSTAVVVALSIPPRSLSFVRAGDRYAAFYGLRIDVLRGDAIVRSERPTGEVRVASFAETTRGDEGILFQRPVRLSPGVYSIRITAQDSLGPGTGTATASIEVPAMTEGVVAPVIPAFVAEPRLSRGAPLTVVANPRATVRYGRDSVLELYIEGYGDAAPDSVVLTALRSGSSRPLLVDTIVLPRGPAVRAARALLPVHRLGLGSVRLTAAARGRSLGEVGAVVKLGLDVPVTTVGELVEAMRYFVGATDLQRLRSASEASRAAQWASLVRRTDPNPVTPDNEALLEYARRLRVAERLYGDSTRHGWQTDRGAVLSALGEPDTMSDPQPADTLGFARIINWEYRRHRLVVSFWDVNTPGQWRLTPVSEPEFRAVVTLLGPCVGCR